MSSFEYISTRVRRSIARCVFCCCFVCRRHCFFGKNSLKTKKKGKVSLECDTRKDISIKMQNERGVCTTAVYNIIYIHVLHTRPVISADVDSIAYIYKLKRKLARIRCEFNGGGGFSPEWKENVPQGDRRYCDVFETNGWALLRLKIVYSRRSSRVRKTRVTSRGDDDRPFYLYCSTIILLITPRVLLAVFRIFRSVELHVES